MKQSEANTLLVGAFAELLVALQELDRGRYVNAQKTIEAARTRMHPDILAEADPDLRDNFNSFADHLTEALPESVRR